MSFSISKYPLCNSAILDTGSTVHIFNQISRFNNFRAARDGDFLWAGDNKVPIEGFGDVDVEVTGPSGSSILRLYDAAFCDNFACNLISFNELSKLGIWLDTDPNRHMSLRRSDRSVLALIKQKHGQLVVEDIDEEFSRHSFLTRRNKFNSYTKRNPQRATADIWHLRLGHPGPQALEHLVNASQGVRIKGIPTHKCDLCATAKAKRQIRRAPRETDVLEPGERLALDFHDFESDYEGYKSLLLVTDRSSGFSWDYYLPDRTATTINCTLTQVFDYLLYQYGFKPRVIECDNEFVDQKPAVKDFLERKNLKLEPSAPYTQAQNGGAERSGGVIKEKARAMRGNLPAQLWSEIVKTAVYLNNRTPKYRLRWKSPYERLYKRKPAQEHLRVYGCKAFAMTPAAQKKTNRLKKLDPRAWIGYLIGYTSSNVYRVWIPSLNRIISTRDVIFDEDQVFDGTLETLILDVKEADLDELAQTLQRISLPNSTSNQGSQQDSNYFEIDSDAHNVDNLTGTDEADVPKYVEARFELLPTPPQTPPAALLAASIREPGGGETDHLSSLQGEWKFLESGGQEATASSDLEGFIQFKQLGGHEATASSDLEGFIQFKQLGGHEATASSDLEGFIQFKQLGGHEATASSDLEGFIQQRQPGGSESHDLTSLQGEPSSFAVHFPTSRSVMDPKKHKVWQAAFNAGRLGNTVLQVNGRALDRAKEQRLLQVPKERLERPLEAAREKLAKLLKDPKQRIHRSVLPPLPSRHRDLDDHLLGQYFKEAEGEHLKSHREMGSWLEVKSKDVPRKITILDCMWVYVYKFDKHGYFKNCKARLVVRGDQQARSGQSTYAATLAGRSFRTLMAISARFDLELIQYDAVNAFVNAQLDEEVYMKMPPGHRRQGYLLRLVKALYGLRKSPLLWHRELTATLKRMGFNSVPHEPCCLTLDGIIVFFYVDDIVFAYNQKNAAKAKNLEAQLQTRYKLTGGKDLQWFLGIEILRDREQLLIWLSQSSYIEKIGKLASTTRPPMTPMSAIELLPYAGNATNTEVHSYQVKVGSLLYAAVITRPDVSFAVSRLAQFNSNPGPEHHKAADRVLQYLVSTSTLALQLGGGDDFEVASDASYADNSIDRKSSQAYAMKLFGGLIGWRANKQDTVTTSTTEAELLALSQAAKESIFVSRLLEDLAVKLDSSQITIQCDNRQTIRLMTEEIASLKTKLRHVDVHNHWLRQEVQKGTIKVTYRPWHPLAPGVTVLARCRYLAPCRYNIGTATQPLYFLLR
ncbi:hypothetical protein HIM_07935 [Hirsutella minnesotensis 3608]|uniref:Integrase catalytic domain-containing protein n=1 Tax=Hirsutella minnesotensis 3608 TaxID=1043627 RepID=A0A0F7ZT99_9HYPO|nr:hypothetical protein HIM_07935 [Hirsutella minnesotensis 3608]